MSSISRTGSHDAQCKSIEQFGSPTHAVRFRSSSYVPRHRTAGFVPNITRSLCPKALVRNYWAKMHPNEAVQHPRQRLTPCRYGYHTCTMCIPNHETKQKGVVEPNCLSIAFSCKRPNHTASHCSHNKNISRTSHAAWKQLVNVENINIVIVLLHNRVNCSGRM